MTGAPVMATQQHGGGATTALPGADRAAPRAGRGAAGIGGRRRRRDHRHPPHGAAAGGGAAAPGDPVIGAIRPPPGRGRTARR
jgi:hypothetical protein